MSRTQRLGFAALAVVIAIVAVVVLAGGSEEEPAADRAATPEATATPAPEEAEPRSTPEAEATPTPEPKPELVEYRQGKAVGGVTRLSFKKGETARFAVASDVDEEIHVHGYDVYKDVPGGGTARFEFKADIEGIFEVEMHGSAVQVAQLRVEP